MLCAHSSHGQDSARGDEISPKNDTSFRYPAELDAAERPYLTKKVLWGFIFAVNHEKLRVTSGNNFNSYDSLKQVKTPAIWGFNWGLSMSVKLLPCLRLVFTPNVGFVERDIYYAFSGKQQHVDSFKLQNTFINLPLEIQLHSPRVFNTDVYLIAGGEYTFGTKGSNIAFANPYTSLNYSYGLRRNTLGLSLGGGLTYSAPYFKVSLEAKYLPGIVNLLVKDGTVYTESLNGVYNSGILFVCRVER